MKKSLPYLLLLAASIAGANAVAEPGIALPAESTQVPLATPVDPDPVAPGDRLLVQGTAQLARHNSVSAKLRHQVAIAGQQLYGVGNYCQQGSGEDLKIRLELQIAGQ